MLYPRYTLEANKTLLLTAPKNRTQDSLNGKCLLICKFI